MLTVTFRRDVIARFGRGSRAADSAANVRDRTKVLPGLPAVARQPSARHSGWTRRPELGQAHSEPHASAKASERAQSLSVWRWGPGRGREVGVSKHAISCLQTLRRCPGRRSPLSQSTGAFCAAGEAAAPAQKYGGARKIAGHAPLACCSAWRDWTRAGLQVSTHVQAPAA